MFNNLTKRYLFNITTNKYRYFTSISNNSNNVIKPPPYKILFFGTDNVSLPVLKLLHQNQKSESPLISELQIICPKSEKKELVESYAIENGLKITYPHPINGMKQFQVPLTETENDGDNQFDLAVVVSFGHFIPKSVLSKFKYGGINMHPSLLPRHRGAAPIYHTILKDDNEAGISIIELHTDRFDCGKILKQVKLDNYQIDKDEYLYEQLLNKLSTLGSENVLDTIRNFPQLSQNAIDQSQIQNGNQPTSAPKVNRLMSKVNWSSLTRNEIWILYKAFSDNIGLHSSLLNKKTNSNKVIKFKQLLKPDDNSIIYKSLLIDLEKYENKHGNLVNGTYFIEFDKSKEYHGVMWVKCKDGWIGVLKVYETGKKNTVKSSEFLFGKNIISINDKDNKVIPISQIFL